MVSVAVVVQVAGLASMAITRICECSASKIRYEAFFLVCLLLVGAFATLMVGAGNDCRLVCALTLPIMAVGATLDMRPTVRDSEI